MDTTQFHSQLDYGNTEREKIYVWTITAYNILEWMMWIIFLNLLVSTKQY